MNDLNTHSGASAISNVVYTTIFKDDLDWINLTKDNQNREQRIHEVIQKYRGEFGE